MQATEPAPALLLALPPDAVQTTAFTPPLLAICSTRFALVQFHPLPGHFAPA